MKKSILFAALVSLLILSCSNNNDMNSTTPTSSDSDITTTIQQLKKINANLKQNKMSATASTELAFTDDEQEFNKVGEMFTRGMDAVMKADKEKSLNKDDIDKEILDRVDSSMGGMSPLERKIVESQEFRSEFEADKANPNLDDLDDLGDSASDRIMGLYLQALKSLDESATEQDVINLTNQYIEVVRNSTGLSESDKDSLFIALSIGTYAFKFWSKFFGK